MTFDTSPNYVFRYSLFPATFPYTIFSPEDKKLFKKRLSNSLEKHYKTYYLREQSLIDRKKEKIHGIYTTW